MTAATRRLALPVVVLSCPPLFLLYRELARCGSAAGCSGLAAGGYAAAALAALPVAVLVTRGAAAGRTPAWIAPRPADATLLAFAGVVVAVDGYLMLALAERVPPAAEALAAPLGVVLGLPLVGVQLLVVGVGNTFSEPPTAVSLFAVAVGVGLSAAWWYVLAAAAGRAVERVSAARE